MLLLILHDPLLGELLTGTAQTGKWRYLGLGSCLLPRPTPPPAPLGRQRASSGSGYGLSWDLSQPCPGEEGGAWRGGGPDSEGWMGCFPGNLEGGHDQRASSSFRRLGGAPRACDAGWSPASLLRHTGKKSGSRQLPCNRVPPEQINAFYRCGFEMKMKSLSHRHLEARFRHKPITLLS